MQLAEYLSEERGRQSALAKSIGAHAPDVSRWANGSRPVPGKYAFAIEKATDGKVTRQELCPNEYRRYWPELKEPLHA